MARRPPFVASNYGHLAGLCTLGLPPNPALNKPLDYFGVCFDRLACGEPLWGPAEDDEAKLRDAAVSEELVGSPLEGNPEFLSLSAASMEYDIPKSTLFKLTARSRGEPGYIWSAKVSGTRFLRRRDVLRLERSRKARARPGWCIDCDKMAKDLAERLRS